MSEQYPKTLAEAVKCCISTLTPEEKQAIINTPRKDLIDFHFSLGKNIRNKFGLWQGNLDLLEDCRSAHPHDASMKIVIEVWRELRRTNS